MKPTTILAAVLVAAGSLYWWNPQAEAPDTPVIQPPTAELRALVNPITVKLIGHSAEAKLLAAFYYEASETVRRDERNGKIIKTKSHFAIFCERATTLRFQGAFTKVSGLAEAIHGETGVLAYVLQLGPGELDHTRAAIVLEAIAWACQEAE